MLKKNITFKIILFFLLPIIIFSCAKSKDGNLELNKNERVYNNKDEYKQALEIQNEEKIDESVSVIDGIYQNNKKQEVFHYNKMYIKPKRVKGKWINTTAIVSFEGENRATLILEYAYNGKNHRGVYLMNSYNKSGNGVETFKYEKIEGDNEEEYFNFAFYKNDKLTITNIANEDVFIFTN